MVLFQEETVFVWIHHCFINHKYIFSKLITKKKYEKLNFWTKKIIQKCLLSARQPFDRLHLNVNDEINGHRVDFFFTGTPQLVLLTFHSKFTHFTQNPYISLTQSLKSVYFSLKMSTHFTWKHSKYSQNLLKVCILHSNVYVNVEEERKWKETYKFYSKSIARNDKTTMNEYVKLK